MSNVNRGRLSVTLGQCAYRVPGLQTIGTVTRKGQTLGLAVDPLGEYFAIGDGKPQLLPKIKVQSAIAALKTGMGAMSQEERMKKGQI